jgi:ribosomal protein S18 acetylase RimI-like enzyme
LTEKSELNDIAMLDNEAFGEHQSISSELLFDIFKQRGILVYRDSGKIVAYSLCVFKSNFLSTPIGEMDVLFYGTYVRPYFRGQSIGKALALAQESKAIEMGKNNALLSVRPENHVSILMRLNLGFEIEKYIPHYFGNNEEQDGRFVLSKSLINNVKSENEQRIALTKIMIKTGEIADMDARNSIKEQFSNGAKIGYYQLINESMAEIGFL